MWLCRVDLKKQSCIVITCSLDSPSSEPKTSWNRALSVFSKRCWPWLSSWSWSPSSKVKSTLGENFPPLQWCLPYRYCGFATCFGPAPSATLSCRTDPCLYFCKISRRSAACRTRDFYFLLWYIYHSMKFLNRTILSFIIVNNFVTCSHRELMEQSGRVKAERREADSLSYRTDFTSPESTIAMIAIMVFTAFALRTKREYIDPWLSTGICNQKPQPNGRGWFII